MSTTIMKVVNFVVGIVVLPLVLIILMSGSICWGIIKVIKIITMVGSEFLNLTGIYQEEPYA